MFGSAQYLYTGQVVIRTLESVPPRSSRLLGGQGEEFFCPFHKKMCLTEKL